jgi:hypothetical protein
MEGKIEIAKRSIRDEGRLTRMMGTRRNSTGKHDASAGLGRGG